jgi:hypothetical protein
MANILEKNHYMMLSKDLVFGQPGYKASEAVGTDVVVRISDDFSTEVELKIADGRTKFFWFDKGGLLVGEKKMTGQTVDKEMEMSYGNGLEMDAKLVVKYKTGKSSGGNKEERPTINWLLVDSMAVVAFKARARVINDPMTSNDIKQGCKIFGQELLLGNGRG